MSKVFISIALGLLVSGCNAASNRVWDKKGNVTINDFNKDKYSCIKEGNQVYPINNQLRDGGYLGYYTRDVNSNSRSNFFADCMQSKRWFLSPKTQ
jgi:hypothetical protein